jgi:hypothetical protein
VPAEGEGQFENGRHRVPCPRLWAGMSDTGESEGTVSGSPRRVFQRILIQGFLGFRSLPMHEQIRTFTKMMLKINGLI